MAFLPTRPVLLCAIAIAIVIFVLYIAKSGRRLSDFHGGLAVCVVGALIILQQGYSEYRFIQRDRSFSNAVQPIAPGGQVFCERLSKSFFNAHNRAGQVEQDAQGNPETQTLIMWRTCNALGELAADPGLVNDPEHLDALLVVVHEAMHMRGITSESEAQCFAMQYAPVVGDALGLNETDVLAGVQGFYANRYSKFPAEYRSPACKPGGTLDVLKDGTWLTTTPPLSALPNGRSKA